MNDSIIVTLSQNTIKEREGGFRKILSEWNKSDGENITWWYRCGNKPKRDFIFVYWVIGGRVRYFSRVCGIERADELHTDDGRIIKGKYWVGCFDFESIPARFQVKRKGFQGFRYGNSSELMLFNY